MESKILQGLNKAQYDAVVNYESPSLIIAGAGSGKTRVLTSRIAYMLEQGVKPWNILALTFTNKAAEQMRSRIEQMVGSTARYIRMGTFHSVFSRILRENAERIGFPQSYTIYETNDSKNLIKDICKEYGLDCNKDKKLLARIFSRISFAKNCLVTPGAYVANATYATEDRQAQMPRFGEIYVEYCRRCKQNGAMDFDDLLLQTNILLRDCPDVLEQYQRLFEYILVDEYQDTNYAQYIIIRRLSQLHGRVCVVGDDAQSIYSFRGAKIENILSFRNDYPQALTFKLEQNYRSTQTIVNAANSVIERNSRRMDKKCFSAGDEGDKIRIVRSYTDREEADEIANALRERIRQTGDSWNEVAILYRTNNQSAVMETALRRRGIPYRIYKGSSFYDHKEIRDMLAYIRLIINPKDDEALKRVINYPARGIGETTVGRIEQLARERGQSMWEAIDTLVAEAATLGDAMQKTIARKVTEFVNLIRSLGDVRREKGLYDFGLEVASRTGILASYRQENTPETQSAIDNIEELLNSMQLFTEQCEAEIRAGEREEENKPTIEEWLQNIMLLTDMDNKEEEGSDEKVTLMTVHSAKGLEYKYIYIAGCEERLFPSERAMESPDGLEEERRLFYVALTRAKAEATLSYCEMRFKWGNMEFSSPSRFLQEIDSRYIDCDEDLRRPQRRNTGDSDSDGALTGRMGNFSRGGYGSGYAGGYGAASQQRGAASNAGRNGGNNSAIEELRKRFDYRFQQKREQQGSRPAPDPRIVQQPAAPRSTEGMRRITRSASSGVAPLGPCAYEVGNRVEHPKFGVGMVTRIEQMAEDYKIVVDFGQYGEKTLLAKFAKLTKL
ncbi:MAG: UvrD-helicase domain-containing protein [Alistipes sp.]|nr:UvrD-helicase domain-containing protein [Alistipes sp.]MBP3564521.1 UvrD-helicase domain-containing protein [Alistipes sp.]